MSRENVERMRRAFEHWLATGEFLAENLHPDFVWDMSTFRGWPERQEYPGIEGARRFNADWGEAWDDWEVEIEDYIDAGSRLFGSTGGRRRPEFPSRCASARCGRSRDMGPRSG